jgi:carbonic anhydrase
MKKMVSLVTAGLFLCIMISCAGEKPHKVHWGYTGHEAPEYWGKLSPDFEMCAKGKNQSPIDLDGFIESSLMPISFNYASGASNIVNNGHTIQVNFAKGSTMAVDGQTFELKQFHFHAPSENHIGGKSFPMEAHLVHADEAGNLAVVAVMYVEGKENTAVKKLWNEMPKMAGGQNMLSEKINASQIMPKNKEYYRFNGSLTTPPCTEGVKWLVLKKYVSVSKEQVDAFSHVMHHPNNRPVQPVNARPVLK